MSHSPLHLSDALSFEQQLANFGAAPSGPLMSPTGTFGYDTGANASMGVNGGLTGGFNSLMGYGGPPQSMASIPGFGPTKQVAMGNDRTGVQAPGGTDWWGRAPTIMQGLGGLAQLYLGMKGLGVAKDSLNFQKDAFNKNYAAQQKMTNRSVYHNWKSGYDASGGQGPSEQEYMSKWGI